MIDAWLLRTGLGWAEAGCKRQDDRGTAQAVLPTFVEQAFGQLDAPHTQQAAEF